MPGNKSYQYNANFSNFSRRKDCGSICRTCIASLALVACLHCSAGNSIASPAADEESNPPLIYADKPGEARQRKIVNSDIPNHVSHRYIKNAVRGQGEIHWDEAIPANSEEKGGDSSGANFLHIKYSIDQYSGDGCRVTFSRRLVIREVRVSSQDSPVEMGDAESSSRTVSFDASAVTSIQSDSLIGALWMVHPELYKAGVDSRFTVRPIVFLGDIDVDGESTREFTVYVSLAELADGVSFADEFEAWLFHLVKMCRYPDSDESV